VNALTQINAVAGPAVIVFNNGERASPRSCGTLQGIGAEGRGFPDRVGERLHLPIEKGGVISTVPLFIYRCPNTGYLVQGFSAEDVSVDAHTYEPVLCPVCKGYHPVNPATSAVLGASDQQAASQRLAVKLNGVEKSIIFAVVANRRA
jgi:hypothetical protein